MEDNNKSGKPVSGGSSIAPAQALTGRDGLMQGAYQAFRKAGFSREGALVMSGEVGRENAYRPQFMFGVHGDPHNKVTNQGIISWQGERRAQLMKFMSSRGLVQENGAFIPGQASLDAQAEFLAGEMKSQNPDIYSYLSKDGIDPNRGMDMVGKSFIRWRIDDPKYRDAGIANRTYFYNRTAALVGDGSQMISYDGGGVAVGGFNDPKMSLSADPHAMEPGSSPVVSGIPTDLTAHLKGKGNLGQLSADKPTDYDPRAILSNQSYIQDRTNSAIAGAATYLQQARDNVMSTGEAQELQANAETTAYNTKLQSEMSRPSFIAPAQKELDKYNKKLETLGTYEQWGQVNNALGKSLPDNFVNEVGDQNRANEEYINSLANDSRRNRADSFGTGLWNSSKIGFRQGLTVQLSNRIATSLTSGEVDNDFRKEISKHVASFTTSSDAAWAGMTQDQVEVLYTAKNMQHLIQLAQAVKQENDDNSYLARQGGITSTAGALLGGLADPTNLLAGAGIEWTIARGAARGLKAAEIAINGSKVATGAATAEKVAANAAMLKKASQARNAAALAYNSTFARSVALNAASGVVETGLQELANPVNQTYTVGDYMVGAAVGGVLGGTIDHIATRGLGRGKPGDIEALQGRISDLHAKSQAMKSEWEKQAREAGHESPEAIQKFVSNKEDDMITRGTMQIIASVNSKIATPRLKAFAEKAVSEQMLDLSTREARDASVAALSSERDLLRKTLDSAARKLNKVFAIPELESTVNILKKNIDEYNEQINILHSDKDLVEADQISLRTKIREIRASNLEQAGVLNTIRKQSLDLIKQNKKQIDDVIKARQGNPSWKSTRASKDFNILWKDMENDINTHIGNQVDRSDFADILGKDVSDMERIALAHRYVSDRASELDPKVMAMSQVLDKVLVKNKLDTMALEDFRQALIPGGGKKKRQGRFERVDRQIQARLAEKEGALTKDQLNHLSALSELEDEIDHLRSTAALIHVTSNEGATGAEIQEAIDDLMSDIRELNSKKSPLVRQKERLEAEIATKTGMDVEFLGAQIANLSDMIDTIDNKIAAEGQMYQDFRAEKGARLYEYRRSLAGDRVGVNNWDVLLQSDIMDHASYVVATEIDPEVIAMSRKQTSNGIRGTMASDYAYGMGGKSDVSKWFMHELAESPFGGGKPSSGAIAKALLEGNMQGRVSFETDNAWKLYKEANGLGLTDSREGMYRKFMVLQDRKYRGLDVTNDPDFPALSGLLDEFDKVSTLRAKSMEAAGVEGAEGLSQNSVGHVSRQIDAEKFLELLRNEPKAKRAMADKMFNEWKDQPMFKGQGEDQIRAIAERFVELQHSKLSGLDLTEFSGRNPVGQNLILEAIEATTSIDDATRALLVKKFHDTPSQLRARLEYDIEGPFYTNEAGQSWSMVDLLVTDPKAINRASASQASGLVVLAQKGITSNRHLNAVLKAVINGQHTEQELRAVMDIMASYTGQRLKGASQPAQTWMTGVASLTRSVLLNSLPFTQSMEFGTIAVNHGIARVLQEMPEIGSHYARVLHAAKNGYARDEVEILSEALGGFTIDGYRGAMDVNSLYSDPLGGSRASKVVKALARLEDGINTIGGQRALMASQRMMSLGVLNKELKDAISTGKIPKILQEAGITDRHIEALSKQSLIDDKGQFNLRLCDDYEVAGEVMISLRRVADQDIMTRHIGENYPFLSGAMGSIFAAMRGFTWLAKDKQMNRILQNRGKLALGMAILTTAPVVIMARMTKVVYETFGMSPEERQEHLDKNLSASALTRATIMYSAHMGILSDALDFGQASASSALNLYNKSLPDGEEKVKVEALDGRYGQGIGGIVPAIGVADRFLRGVRNGDPKQIFLSLPGTKMIWTRPLANYLFSKPEDE